jgi:hypothetical protein
MRARRFGRNLSTPEGFYRKLGTRPQVDGEVTLMVFPGKKAHHGP